MIECPKCGSTRILAGFDDETYDGEWLISWDYIDNFPDDVENMYSYLSCGNCGYDWEPESGD